MTPLVRNQRMKPRQARLGIGGHARPNRGLTDDWITPPEIVGSLGSFDLDPCACIPQPWPCAAREFTVEHDGLAQDWDGYGRVWLNPPYGFEVAEWLNRLAAHGDGIALIFARTETAFFQQEVFGKADGILFLAGRLFFSRPDGTRAKHNSGGPSCLVAYGDGNVDAIRASGLPGALVTTWERSEPWAQARPLFTRGLGPLPDSTEVERLRGLIGKAFGALAHWDEAPEGLLAALHDESGPA